MPRRHREATGGIVYHVLNRGVGRMDLFEDGADYQAFERVLVQATMRLDCRVLCYCLMPNHWHLCLWPRDDGDLSEFMRWLTVTHTQRWHAHHHSAGTGPIYQGRFKSFPVQSDSHFLGVARYIERNAMRAGLVSRAEDWQWSSLWRRRHGSAKDRALLHRWPVQMPRQWLRRVNQPETRQELDALRCCAKRGQPFGGDQWRTQMVTTLGLASSMNPIGRPKKKSRRKI